MKKWISILMVCLLSACSMDNGTSSQSMEYRAKLPFEHSDARIKHVGILSSVDDRVQVESGLMDLSKSHFDSSQLTYLSHHFLDFDELDATDGSRGLLGTLRDDNPNGLNPTTDTQFDTGNGLVTSATILVDIYELDFYQKNDLKGLSLGLVVNKKVGDNVSITGDKMREYLKVTMLKLANYLRSRFNEIHNDIPIYMAAFGLDGSDGLGSYFYSGYFSGSSQQYHKITEEWIAFPTSEANSMDANLSTQFNRFSDSLKEVLVDDTYVTARAKYVDEKANLIKIVITAHGKTAAELLALMQAAKSGFSEFKDDGLKIIVRIDSNNETYALLSKEANSQTVNVVTAL